jgi:hypothetical protein
VERKVVGILLQRVGEVGDRGQEELLVFFGRGISPEARIQEGLVSVWM